MSKRWQVAVVAGGYALFAVPLWLAVWRWPQYSEAIANGVLLAMVAVGLWWWVFEDEVLP